MERMEASRGSKTLMGEVFTKLATAALPCDGGASELRLCAKDAEVLGHHLAAVRFAFHDGPAGFNVYREINLVGQATGK